MTQEIATLSSISQPVHGVRMLTLPHRHHTVNVYLLEGEPLTLVDTGNNGPATLRPLVENLARLGYGFAGIEQIIITHAHFDHFGSAGLIQAHGARALAPSGKDASLYADVPRLWFESRECVYDLARLLGTPEEAIGEMKKMAIELALGDSVNISRLLSDNDVVRAGSADWVAVHTPGHERDHICLYDPRRKLLLSGDHLLPHIVPVPLLDAPANGFARRRPGMEYLTSLDRIARLDVDLVLPGHGEVIRDHRAVIMRCTTKNSQRKDLVLQQLRKGATTPYALMRALYPGTSMTDVYMSLSKVVGHLDQLEAEGRATVEMRDDNQYYRAT